MSDEMKKTIEICGSFSGVITTNINYENRNPFFSVKEVIENCIMTDDEIQKRQQELNDICHENYKMKLNEIKNIRPVVETAKEVFSAVETDTMIKNKCEFLAAISDCKSVNDLTMLGIIIAKDKNKLTEQIVQDLRDEFNTKMYNLKGEDNGKQTITD